MAASASATISTKAHVVEPPSRHPIDGRSFPDKVVALTWDDGPDTFTLELASYLREEQVSGTFFVVGEWIRGVSDEPGYGKDLEASGHSQIRVLADLVALGHRVGNHTFDHVLLGPASPAMVREQLRDNQAAIDPFISDELPMFRAPGGAFNDAASVAMDADPALRPLVGPIAWDIDRKDWHASVACRSERAAIDCDHGGPDGTLRTKPAVIAKRYLESIESAGHGIVLFHDRVGHRGSTYALEIARALIPQLKARHFVFTAPVLTFSPETVRLADPEDDSDDPPIFRALDASSLRIADVDGDGQEDVCARAGTSLSCALAFERAGHGPTARPRASFRPAAAAGPAVGALDGTIVPGTRGARATMFDLADVDGDGLADACVRGASGLACAVATGGGLFGTIQPWSASSIAPWQQVTDFSDAEGWGSAEGYARSVRFADIDGDGKADVCGRSPRGVVCARSLGKAFDHERIWLGEMSDARGWFAPEYATTMMLGDVNGDGSADLCARAKEGIVCALSRKTSFGKLERWSTDFSDADKIPWARDPSYYGTLRLGDINGDGRADVCGRGPAGIVCALSTGQGFTRATLWLAGMTDELGWRRPDRALSIQLGDINGDGRADICGRDQRGIVCGLAP